MEPHQGVGMNSRHFLITGGSSGIGLSLAEKLVADGATVHLTGRNDQALQKVRASLGEQAFVYAGDVSDQIHLSELVERVGKRTGHSLDGLIINAAKYGYKPLLEQDGTDFEDYFQTNTTSAFHLVKGCYPLLKKGTGKSVLFISSTLSTRPVPGTGAYAASKAALNCLAQTFALELAPEKIRVNVILPGVVDTGIHNPAAPGDPSKAEKLAALAPLHPLGRVGNATEIADAAHFLLSHKTKWVTGSLFYVDGGISIA